MCYTLIRKEANMIFSMILDKYFKKGNNNFKKQIDKNHLKEMAYLKIFHSFFSLSFRENTVRNDEKTTAEIWNKLSNKELKNLEGEVPIKKIMQSIIADVVQEKGIEMPKFSIGENKGILKRTVGTAIRSSGKLEFYKQKYSIFNKKTLGLNVGYIADVVSHECQHIKQFAHTNEFFSGEQDISNKYRLIAVLEGLRLIDATLINRNPFFKKLNEFADYYYDITEIDARISGANYLMKLIQNEYIAPDLRKKFLKCLKQIYRTDFAPNANLQYKLLSSVLGMEKRLNNSGLNNININKECYFLLEDFNKLKKDFFRYVMYLNNYSNNLKKFITEKEKEGFKNKKLNEEKSVI